MCVLIETGLFLGPTQIAELFKLQGKFLFRIDSHQQSISFSNLVGSSN